MGSGKSEGMDRRLRKHTHDPDKRPYGSHHFRVYHAHVIAVEATEAYEPDDILAREPDGCQHIPEPAPLRMARFITAIIMSVFFAVYSSIRPCRASPLLRYLKNHLASSSSDIPNFPSLPFSPSSAKSRIIWIIHPLR